MEYYVFDTYVKADDGHTMHFDVITAEKNHEKAISYGKEWLKSIGQEKATMTSKECQFCHTESVPEPTEKAIKETGYSILKLEGCP
jgi:hypothetical protein